jgi:hypothetical protein
MQFFRNGIEITRRDAHDDRGILRDGVVARTRMTARDSASRFHITDGNGDGGVALCRPGFRQLRSDDQLGDQLTRDSKREAYRDYQDRMSNAWRTPGKHADNAEENDDDEIPCPLCEGTGELDGGVECPRCHGDGFLANDYGAYPYSAAAEGQSCTINGRPGHLRKQGGGFTCVPDKGDRRTVDQMMRDHKAHMDKVYADYAHETANAWRKR